MEADNPECFGLWREDKVRCQTCLYRESCRFAREDAQKNASQDLRWNTAYEYMDNLDSLRSSRKAFPSPDDYEEIRRKEHFSDAVRKGAKADGLLPVDFSEERLYTRDEVVALSAFLMRLGGDRKLGKIIHAKLSGAPSFAEIARREGVTRQAIHKRVGKQLAKLLGFKKRRLTDSRLMTLEVDEFALLKMTRNGMSDEEIASRLHLRTMEFRHLQKSLERKLIRYT